MGRESACKELMLDLYFANYCVSPLSTSKTKNLCLRLIFFENTYMFFRNLKLNNAQRIGITEESERKIFDKFGRKFFKREDQLLHLSRVHVLQFVAKLAAAPPPADSKFC